MVTVFTAVSTAPGAEERIQGNGISFRAGRELSFYAVGVRRELYRRVDSGLMFGNVNVELKVECKRYVPSKNGQTPSPRVGS